MDSFTKYYKKRLDSILSILQKTKGKFSTKNFHKVRTEIKKIKAITSFINYCTSDSIKKVSIRPYNNIFARAGKVRELQFGITFLKRLKLLDTQSGLARSLAKRFKKERSAFFLLKFSKLSRKMKKNYRRVESLSASLDNNFVDHYWNLKNNEIRELLESENLQKNQIHDLRKRIKELYFVEKLLPSTNNKSKSIMGFQELLGDWHDHIVFENDLKKAIDSGDLSSKEITSVDKLKGKIRAESEQMFIKINSKMPNYFQSAVNQN